MEKQLSDIKDVALIMAPKDSWKLDPTKLAFIVIDIQMAYMVKGAPLECLAFRKFIPKVNSIADVCRRLSIPVVYVYNSFRSDLSDVGLMQEFRPRTNSEWEPIEGRRGVALAEGLKVKETDYLVAKSRYSAFTLGSSRLGALLRGLHRDNIIVCGGATDVCLGATTIDAMMLDYRVFIIGDLTATFSEERQQIALRVLDAHYAKVVTSTDILQELKNHASIND